MGHTRLLCDYAELVPSVYCATNPPILAESLDLESASCRTNSSDRAGRRAGRNASCTDHEEAVDRRWDLRAKVWSCPRHRTTRRSHLLTLTSPDPGGKADPVPAHRGWPPRRPCHRRGGPLPHITAYGWWACHRQAGPVAWLTGQATPTLRTPERGSAPPEEDRATTMPRATARCPMRGGGLAAAASQTRRIA